MLARMEQNPHAVFYERELADRFPKSFAEARRAALIRRVPSRLDGRLYGLGLGRSLTVVSDGDRIEAFDDEDPEAETVELPLAALARWRLDLDALARQFQKANNLQGSPAPLHERLFFVGDIEQGSQRITGVLAFVSDTRSARLVLTALPGLVATSYSRILVLCPTFTPNPVLARQLEALGVSTTTLRESDPFKLDICPVQRRPKGEKGESGDFRASEDYRVVVLRGTQYALSTKQARAVAALHKAYQQGIPFLGQSMVLKQIGSRQLRLRDVFRTSKAWGTLIISGEGRGFFGLNL